MVLNGGECRHSIVLCYAVPLVRPKILNICTSLSNLCLEKFPRIRIFVWPAGELVDEAEDLLLASSSVLSSSMKIVSLAVKLEFYEADFLIILMTLENRCQLTIFN
jgi:hypothetical protein